MFSDTGWHQRVKKGDTEIELADVNGVLAFEMRPCTRCTSHAIQISGASTVFGDTATTVLTSRETKTSQTEHSKGADGLCVRAQRDWPRDQSHVPQDDR